MMIFERRVPYPIFYRDLVGMEVTINVKAIKNEQKVRLTASGFTHFIILSICVYICNTAISAFL
jgi:hypothetical protein